MTIPAAPALDANVRVWLDTHAAALDEGVSSPEDLTPKLGQAGLFSIGVPSGLGGHGGSIVDAILSLAGVASHSLTAAFVLWGQRTFIEYLLHSPNDALRERQLPALLEGRHAGATGLSNAMKYLGGIESLQVQAADAPHGLSVSGKLPWVTNLRKGGFVVAAVAERQNGRAPSIIAIPHDAPGVSRSPDLDLVALRSSNTAAIDLVDVQLDASSVIDDDALRFLSRVRPAFLGLQCGLSIGLARRCLSEAQRAADALSPEIDAIEHRLALVTQRLLDGVASNAFRVGAAPQFELRIELAEIASSAAALEIQAAGGRGYLRSTRETNGPEVARRWREAAFIPIVTPSLTQLKTELARHAATTVA